MKRLAIILLLFINTLSVAKSPLSHLPFVSHPLKGNGELMSVKRVLPSFNQIQVDGPIDIQVRAAKKTSVIVMADSNIVPKVVTEVNKTILSIHYDKKVKLESTDRVLVKINLPELLGYEYTGKGNTHLSGHLGLEHLKVSGAGSVVGSQLGSKNFVVQAMGSGDINLSGNLEITAMQHVGAGDIKLHGIKATQFQLIDRGSGQINLTGVCDNLKVSVTGSSEINAKKLESTEAKVEVFGSAKISVFAKNKLTASVAGSGDIAYFGQPKDVTQQVYGSGKIHAG